MSAMSPITRTTCPRRSIIQPIFLKGQSYFLHAFDSACSRAKHRNYSSRRAFTSKTSLIWDLKDMINSVNNLFKDSSVLGSFISNHDSQSAWPLDLR